MRIYISGKITGDEKYLQKFMEAQMRLEAEGHQVINPAMMSGVMPGATWGEYLLNGLNMLRDHAEGVVMLPDWKDSKGACLEYGHATGLEIPVYMYQKEGRPIFLAGMETMLLE